MAMVFPKKSVPQALDTRTWQSFQTFNLKPIRRTKNTHMKSSLRPIGNTAFETKRKNFFLFLVCTVFLPLGLAAADSPSGGQNPSAVKPAPATTTHQATEKKGSGDQGAKDVTNPGGAPSKPAGDTSVASWWHRLFHAQPVVSTEKSKKAAAESSGIAFGDMSARFPGTFIRYQNQGGKQSTANSTNNRDKNLKSGSWTPMRAERALPEPIRSNVYVPKLKQQHYTDVDSAITLAPSRVFPEIEYYFATGWQSADIYKGVDKTSEAGFPLDGDPTGHKVKRTSIVYTKLGAGSSGFGAAVTYIRSLDRISPRYGSALSLANGGGVASPIFYEELDFSLNYSFQIVPQKLEMTLGFNEFLALHRSFWFGHGAEELYATVAVTSIPHIRPSITYSQFFSGTDQLKGGFCEIRMDTYGYEVYRDNRIKVEINPYLSLGIDNNLIGDHADWGSVQFGVKAPIELSNRAIFSLNANYGISISDRPNNFHTDAAATGFFGGVSFTVKF